MAPCYGWMLVWTLEEGRLVSFHLLCPAEPSGQVAFRRSNGELSSELGLRKEHRKRGREGESTSKREGVLKNKTNRVKEEGERERMFEGGRDVMFARE